jgi:hypothetical protein
MVLAHLSFISPLVSKLYFDALNVVTSSNLYIIISARVLTSVPTGLQFQLMLTWPQWTHLVQPSWQEQRVRWCTLLARLDEANNGCCFGV